jgi:hypothetical protein
MEAVCVSEIAPLYAGEKYHAKTGSAVLSCIEERI